MLTLLLACGPAGVVVTDKGLDSGIPIIGETDADVDADGDTDADTDGDTDADSDTDTDSDTTPTDTTEPGDLDYDCDALPAFNLGDRTLSDARGYHGVTFDDDGNLLGYDGGQSFAKSRYGGERSVFVPGLAPEGMDRLHDGDFVVSETAGARLVRVTPEGGSETLASGVGYVYGVIVGPDGMIYVTDGNLSRVDPDTGEVTRLIDGTRRYNIHTMNFNLDSTQMYLGTIGRGTVWVVDVDEALNPVGEPVIYAENVGAGWHDAVGVDACGNLWVPDYSSSGLYRVGLDGTVTAMVDARSTLYGHGLEWGSGINGWRGDTLYMPQPYNGATVREVIIGVPTGELVRTWKGVPVRSRSGR